MYQRVTMSSFLHPISAISYYLSNSDKQTDIKKELEDVKKENEELKKKIIAMEEKLKALQLDKDYHESYHYYYAGRLEAF